MAVSDQDIRRQIIKVLYGAYRVPKGMYKHVSFHTLSRDVKKEIECQKEDVYRELNYLIDTKWIKENRLSHPSVVIGKTKIPASKSIYYTLTPKAIDSIGNNTDYANIGYMLQRHRVRIVKSTGESTEYPGDFQSTGCFLNIKTDVEEGDTIQLLGNGKVLDEKIVGEVQKNFGPPEHLAHIKAIWQKKQSFQSQSNVTITNSLVNAPVTTGQNNSVFSVTFNKDNDIKKILDVINDRADISTETKVQLTQIVNSDLPSILENNDVAKASSLKEKLKTIGQSWLIPIVAQVVGTYITHSLGVNG